MSKEDYAFPSEIDDGKQYNWLHKGMTLRDYFAAKAMQAYLTDPEYVSNKSNYALTAKASYSIADAMLKQREIER